MVSSKQKKLPENPQPENEAAESADDASPEMEIQSIHSRQSNSSPLPQERLTVRAESTDAQIASAQPRTSVNSPQVIIHRVPATSVRRVIHYAPAQSRIPTNIRCAPAQSRIPTNVRTTRPPSGIPRNVQVVRPVRQIPVAVNPRPGTRMPMPSSRLPMPASRLPTRVSVQSGIPTQIPSRRAIPQRSFLPRPMTRQQPCPRPVATPVRIDTPRRIDLSSPSTISSISDCECDSFGFLDSPRRKYRGGPGYVFPEVGIVDDFELGPEPFGGFVEPSPNQYRPIEVPRRFRRRSDAPRTPPIFSHDPYIRQRYGLQCVQSPGVNEGIEDVVWTSGERAFSQINHDNFYLDPRDELRMQRINNIEAESPPCLVNISNDMSSFPEYSEIIPEPLFIHEDLGFYDVTDFSFVATPPQFSPFNYESPGQPMDAQQQVNAPPASSDTESSSDAPKTDESGQQMQPSDISVATPPPWVPVEYQTPSSGQSESPAAVTPPIYECHEYVTPDIFASSYQYHESPLLIGNENIVRPTTRIDSPRYPERYRKPVESTRLEPIPEQFQSAYWGIPPYTPITSDTSDSGMTPPSFETFSYQGSSRIASESPPTGFEDIQPDSQSFPMTPVRAEAIQNLRPRRRINFNSNDEIIVLSPYPQFPGIMSSSVLGSPASYASPLANEEFPSYSTVSSDVSFPFPGRLIQLQFGMEESLRSNIEDEPSSILIPDISPTIHRSDSPRPSVCPQRRPPFANQLQDISEIQTPPAYNPFAYITPLSQHSRLSEQTFPSALMADDLFGNISPISYETPPRYEPISYQSMTPTLLSSICNVSPPIEYLNLTDSNVTPRRSKHSPRRLSIGGRIPVASPCTPLSAQTIPSGTFSTPGTFESIMTPIEFDNISDASRLSGISIPALIDQSIMMSGSPQLGIPVASPCTPISAQTMPSGTFSTPGTFESIMTPIQFENISDASRLSCISIPTLIDGSPIMSGSPSLRSPQIRVPVASPCTPLSAQTMPSGTFSTPGTFESVMTPVQFEDISDASRLSRISIPALIDGSAILSGSLSLRSPQIRVPVASPCTPLSAQTMPSGTFSTPGTFESIMTPVQFEDISDVSRLSRISTPAIIDSAIMSGSPSARSPQIGVPFASPCTPLSSQTMPSGTFSTPGTFESIMSPVQFENISDASRLSRISAPAIIDRSSPVNEYISTPIEYFNFTDANVTPKRGGPGKRPKRIIFGTPSSTRSLTIDECIPIVSPCTPLSSQSMPSGTFSTPGTFESIMTPVQFENISDTSRLSQISIPALIHQSGKLSRSSSSRSSHRGRLGVPVSSSGFYSGTPQPVSLQHYQYVPVASPCTPLSSQTMPSGRISTPGTFESIMTPVQFENISDASRLSRISTPALINRSMIMSGSPQIAVPAASPCTPLSAQTMPSGTISTPGTFESIMTPVKFENISDASRLSQISSPELIDRSVKLSGSSLSGSRQMDRLRIPVQSSGFYSGSPQHMVSQPYQDVSVVNPCSPRLVRSPQLEVPVASPCTPLSAQTMPSGTFSTPGTFESVMTPVQFENISDASRLSRVSIPELVDKSAINESPTIFSPRLHSTNLYECVPAASPCTPLSAQSMPMETISTPKTSPSPRYRDNIYCPQFCILSPIQFENISDASRLSEVSVPGFIVQDIVTEHRTPDSSRTRSPIITSPISPPCYERVDYKTPDIFASDYPYHASPLTSHRQSPIPLLEGRPDSPRPTGVKPRAKFQRRLSPLPERYQPMIATIPPYTPLPSPSPRRRGATPLSSTPKQIEIESPPPAFTLDISSPNLRYRRTSTPRLQRSQNVYRDRGRRQRKTNIKPRKINFDESPQQYQFPLSNDYVAISDEEFPSYETTTSNYPFGLRSISSNVPNIADESSNILVSDISPTCIDISSPHFSLPQYYTQAPQFKTPPTPQIFRHFPPNTSMQANLSDESCPCDSDQTVSTIASPRVRSPQRISSSRSRSNRGSGPCPIPGPSQRASSRPSQQRSSPTSSQRRSTQRPCPRPSPSPRSSQRLSSGPSQRRSPGPSERQQSRRLSNVRTPTRVAPKPTSRRASASVHLSDVPIEELHMSESSVSISSSNIHIGTPFRGCDDREIFDTSPISNVYSDDDSGFSWLDRRC